jgi:PKD repeat protein
LRTVLGTLLVPAVVMQPLPAAAQAPGSASVPRESRLSIRHDPLKCLTPEERPDVGAAVRPEPRFAAGYVYFRAANAEKKGFYYVVLEGPPAGLKAALPRPLPSTTAVEYFLQAIDTARTRERTEQYVPAVKPSGTCAPERAPSRPPNDGLTVGLTEEGQDPVPPGFNRADIAKVILASGVVVTLAAALKGAGAGGAAAAGGTGGGAAGGTAAGAAAGGISTGVLVGGGLAVAAGVAVAAGSGGGGDDGGSPSTPPSPSVTVGASPVNGPAPLAVQFSANASGGTSPYSWAWTFGDGNLSNQQSPQHTYRGAGTFNASLTVTDARQRTTSGSVLVTVAAPPSFRFLEADVTWAGGGDLDLAIFRNGAEASGSGTVRAGCDSSGRSRTERVLVQGAALGPGTYTQAVTARACPGDTASTGITGVLTVVTDQGSRCQQFFTVGPGGTYTAPQACQVVQP